jgi:hypothetical protein
VKYVTVCRNLKEICVCLLEFEPNSGIAVNFTQILQSFSKVFYRNLKFSEFE